MLSHTARQSHWSGAGRKGRLVNGGPSSDAQLLCSAEARLLGKVVLSPGLILEPSVNVAGEGRKRPAPGTQVSPSAPATKPLTFSNKGYTLPPNKWYTPVTEGFPGKTGHPDSNDLEGFMCGWALRRCLRKER